MQIHTHIAPLRTALEALRAADPNPLALVPTMGALHRGHLSLVARAKSECGPIVASLFVNPLQFGPNEDFDRYPRHFETDCELFAAAGVDLLFAPAAAEMVPSGSLTAVDVGPIANRLDGASRPGHFRGVATIVAKLFHLIQPNRAYFGQKDAMQLAILRQMVRDLDFPVHLVACPVVRDPDGLALSSRNRYLSPDERARARTIPRALDAIRAQLATGATDANTVRQAGLDLIDRLGGIDLEYLETVDAITLEPVGVLQPGTLVAIAARVGNTRLIDNLLV